MTGELKGYGKPLDKSEMDLFNAGRFAFDNKRVDWCDSRIESFEKVGDYKFEYIKRKWVYSSEETEKNPNSEKAKNFEDWIARNCALIVDQFIDTKITSTFYFSDVDFNVKFAKSKNKSGTNFKFKIGEGDVLSFGGRYLISSQFVSALKKEALIQEKPKK